jgi:cell division protein FtsA
MNSFITGVDVGSGKVCVAIARATKEGPQICGAGLSRSRGIYRGAISDLAEATDCIQEAINRAEKSAGTEIWSAFLSIDGATSSYSCMHSINIQNESGMVKQKDLKNLKNNIKFSNGPLDREIILIEPNFYTLDGQGRIKNPLGMIGNRLEGKFCVVTLPSIMKENFKKCIYHIGIDIERIVPSAVALSYSCLRDYEKENGVVLIDIGFGITNISVFLNESIVYIKSIDIGGADITASISSGFQVYPDQAEEAKRQFGCIFAKEDCEQIFPIRGMGLGLKQNRIVSCVRGKVEELFKNVCSVLDESGYRGKINCAVVVGGESMLDGLQEIGETILGLPLRTGSARGFVSGMDALHHPTYAVALGLVQIGYSEKRVRPKKSHTGLFEKIKDRLKILVEEYF